MSFQKVVFAVALFFVSATVLAQKGTIRGKVIDEATGEPMIGVSVVIKGTTIGAPTDLEGAFSFPADPGTYDLQASFISFETVTVSGVMVKPGEVTLVGTIRLGESVEQMEEVVVRAQVVRETEAALLTVKRKSPNLIDGISSETFSKIGDSDAAGAIKRVPGVSVQGGQYVFVRGLGDRYTKTTLNSMEIPGLDPDRNAVQMDIFPTNLINNIVVYKSFTPDLAADFVGGIVDVELKDFPATKVSSFSISTTYNPDMHFRNDFLTYKGGSTDFLGFDDGTRELPYDAQENGQLPNATNQERIELLRNVTQRFTPDMAVSQTNSLPNLSMSYALGNQFDKSGYKLGYNLALNYGASSTFYEDARDASYAKPAQKDQTELIADTRFAGPLAVKDVQFSGLFGTSIKTDNSKYSLKLLRIQNGTERAALRTRVRSLDNFNTSIVDGLEYTERFLNNATISGDHFFADNTASIKWKGAATFSTINDKDVRITPFTLDDDTDEPTINAQEGGEPNRIWRLLDEQNFSGKVDYEKEFKFNNNTSKFKAGASDVFKMRDYAIQDFFVRFLGNIDNLNINGDADRILAEENVIDTDDGGSYMSSRFTPSNAYSGSINIAGAYVSTELGLTERLKTIFGLRAEKYDQFFTGQNQSGDRVFDNDKVLNSFELFPSFNLTFSPGENSNLRASYARTIARPSFKEKSTVEIQDVLTGRTFIGNIDLVETNINNYDLRYEFFFQRGQTISVGTFYKTFENPIELVRQSANANNIKPTNVGDASIFGAELEVRKDFGFISEALANFSVKGNFTVTEAIVNIDETEKQGRLNGLRDGEQLEEQRSFVGQPPYIVNTSLDYLNFETNWEASLSYNVQGPTLAIVGINRTPDTYTVPFHSLNFNVSKAFGLDNKNKIGFRVTNILGDIQEREFRSFGSSNQIETSRELGRSFRIKYSRTF